MIHVNAAEEAATGQQDCYQTSQINSQRGLLEMQLYFAMDFRFKEMKNTFFQYKRTCESIKNYTVQSFRFAFVPVMFCTRILKKCVSHNSTKE